jgi:hypothetical protein
VRVAGPAVGSATGSATRRPLGGLGGGGDAGPVEFIPNPTLAGDGAPWEALLGSAILVGSGQALWGESGSLQTPLSDTLPNGGAFTGSVFVSSNPASVTMTVRLYNAAQSASQVLYTGTPGASATIPLSGTASADRAYMRIDGGEAGLRVTSVSLTA